MDISPVLNELIKLWWVLPILFAISLMKTSWFKGIWGEALVKLAARMLLPAKTYHAVHDVTLSTPDGTTQIDHVFISKFGIFVVETKNMKGWIFGTEKQRQWTQKLFNKSFKFQNPLRQNYKHVNALAALLNLPPNVLHSVVVFTGSSKFKSPMPANVTASGGYIAYIKSIDKPVLSESQIETALSQINSERLPQTRRTRREHVQQLQTRHEQSTRRKCPKCGNSMVLRTAKRGENAGKKFWGCSGYPQCKTVFNND